jgi:uncharacterized protein YggE
MIGAIKRGIIHLAALGLGVGLLALVACGSEAETPAANAGLSTAQQQQLADLAGVLTSPAGSAAYEALVRSATGISAGTNAGIWVSGQGEASAAPDLATLNLSIVAFASTVAEARTSAAEAMGQTLEVLKSQGVAERAIQTSYFNVNARYTTREVTRCFDDEETREPEVEPSVLPLGAPEPPEPMVQLEAVGRPKTGNECVLEREQAVLGYQATNQLSVKVRVLDSLGGIIDEAIEAGGDVARFQNVSFSIENSEALKDQARAAAIQDLRAKAEQIASLAGVELGRLNYITETGGFAPSPMVVMERAAFDARSAPTPIMTGELDITVSVQAAFEIQQPEA